MIDKNAEKQKGGKRMNLINIEHISKTLLEILKMEKPIEMTGKSLLIKK